VSRCVGYSDVVGGHEFLGRDQRVEQRRVHRAEYGQRWVAERRPTAQVTVSSVLP